jgi:hypothetical protein
LCFLLFQFFESRENIYIFQAFLLFLFYLFICFINFIFFSFLLSINDSLILGEGRLDVDGEELIDLAVGDAAAVLLAEDGLGLQVVVHAGDLATALEELEDEVGRRENGEETAIAVGGVAADAVDGRSDRLLDLRVDADVEGVRGAEHAVDGGWSGGVEPEATAESSGELEVEAAAGLGALLDLVVLEGLVAAPADHPFVGFLLDELDLVGPGHYFFVKKRIS